MSSYTGRRRANGVVYGVADAEERQQVQCGVEERTDATGVSDALSCLGRSPCALWHGMA
jgi:hypothetical protein